MQTIHSDQDQYNIPLVKQDELSLSDLANAYFTTPSSITKTKVDGDTVKGEVTEQVKGDTTSSSTASLPLANLTHSKADDFATQQKIISHSSNYLSLSELASMDMSTHSTENGCQSYKDNSVDLNLPLLEMSSQLDFSTGFTTPKSSSTLSLSQLASLGSNSISNKSYKMATVNPLPYQNDTGSLAALASVHLNSLKTDNVTKDSVDLSSVKPPPGLAPHLPPNMSVVTSSQDTPLNDTIDRLTIEDPCVSPTSASVFASIICMTERVQPKRIIKRHRHLKKKSWRILINPHKTRIPFFTFNILSPDDFVLRKQEQVFNS